MRGTVVVWAWVGCVAAPPPKPPPSQPEVAAPVDSPKQELPEPSQMADQLMHEIIDLMTDMRMVLESISDQPTARIALPRLEDLTQKGEALKVRAITVRDALTNEEKAALKAKFEEPMRDAAERLLQETMRVSKIPGAAEALRAMKPKPAAP